ncbi:MAG TPA: flagellar hook-basal body complex protein [Rhodospirillales bacterium]|nr:flagellar hook-basal body complex protein [Rhodospirillales bacterium]
MSLFGAMTSGVSALGGQSGAMGAIADNIANVNTVGYKNAKVAFQTLVTKQASATMYAAGGVQARPRNAIDVQGLLQPTVSETDLAVSGDGFFVVNAASTPTDRDQFLFTRAGSFTKDSDGFLRNTAGYYLQAWPTNAAGEVILPPGSDAALTNQNVISPDFLQTVDLNRVAVNAQETTQISIGANLPANSSVGDTHALDVRVYDTLGNTNAVAFSFIKTGMNEWDLRVEPPTGAGVVTLYDNAGNPTQSVGQLEFKAVPDVGESMIIGGQTYTFVAGATVAGSREIQVDGGRNLAQVVGDLRDEINLDIPGAASAKPDNATVLLLTGGGAPIAVDPNGVSAGGRAATKQTTAYIVDARVNTDPAFVFSATGYPTSITAERMAIRGFEAGAADMDDVDLDGDGLTDVSRIDLRFGADDGADNLTQFGGDFVPGAIQQDGSQFGTFTDVAIRPDGVIEAIFKNGSRRPIYRIPVATFASPDGLQSRNGNVFIATENSGDPTLREADSGPAGKINSFSLEGATVDIGEEFTNMIVTQRAYSAATKVISTADEMLDELIRTKR